MNATTAQPCLFCGAVDYQPSLEHILPEALGCPADLVLHNGICQACNNGLGHVDQALVRQFELPAFMAGVPRKNGRKPSVDGWGSFHASVTSDGPTIRFNGGPDDVTMDGRRLKAASPQTGVLEKAFGVENGVASVQFSLAISGDGKLLRALYKIALELVLLHLGPTRALAADLDPVRAFVRQGLGAFDALVTPGDERYQCAFTPPFSAPDGEGLAVAVLLFGVEFNLDLMAGQADLEHWDAEARRQPELGAYARLAAPRGAPAKRRKTARPAEVVGG
jgi:hypothetical protein